MTEPRTEAGRALVHLVLVHDSRLDGTVDYVVRIEEQAAALERERLRDAGRVFHVSQAHPAIVMRHAVSGAFEDCDTPICRAVLALLAEPTP